MRGPVHAAQSMLLDRLRDPAVWRYWYWENLLGNWDFRRRRTGPRGIGGGGPRPRRGCPRPHSAEQSSRNDPRTPTDRSFACPRW
ncbi:hypothetical protein [Nocardia wallacei]|uniref:hypothetical protein n=1 Tax=Nocardia wallacei TaxID=480035 RepID=UPI003CC80AA3